MDVLEKLEEKRLARKVYMRKYMVPYYSEHKETILQQQVAQKARYREKHREAIRERDRLAYHKKKELLLDMKQKTIVPASS